MKRPRVTIENSQSVYEHYSNNVMNPRFAKFAFGVFSKVFRSNVSWREGVQDTIDGHLSEGGQLILAANHTSDYDQFVVAALPMQEDVFKPLLGTSFIPAKQPLFAKPGLRHAVDALGAVPVFRKKDAERRGDATKQYFDMCVKRINHGQHMAIFPEGTRNKTNPEQVQELYSGLGKIVCAVEVENLLILPIGINYIPKTCRPRVYIGIPIGPPFGDIESITEQTKIHLQLAVDSTR